MGEIYMQAVVELTNYRVFYNLRAVVLSVCSVCLCFM